MSRLAARLILAMLILPMTGALFVLLFVLLMMPGGGPPSLGDVLTLWLIIYAFVAAYWVLLWRSSVRWTKMRIAGTIAAGALAVLAACVLGFVVEVHALGADPEFALFLAGGLVPIVWVLATVLIWRETPRERMERMALAGREMITCPICGYNLTGLTEARCPECGSSFTLDQLVQAQPRRDEEGFAQG